MPTRQNHNYLAWAEIDLSAIRFNFRQIKQLASRLYVQERLFPKQRKRVRRPPELLPIIKADAYGHGMLKVAGMLKSMGVGYFGVSDLNEGITLRKHGIKKPILLLETPLPSCAREIVEYNLTPTVCTVTLASSLNNCARTVGRKVNIHIKVDTGMGRLGVSHSEARSFIREVMNFPALRIEGLYTHFPLADVNPEFTKNQIREFYGLVQELDREGKSIPYIHAANSMGVSGYSGSLNLARPGLMLYGLYPSENLRRKIKLLPAMQVKARVVFVKNIPRGTGVSYGHTFIADKEMKVATIPIGYSNGYLRSFSNNAAALVDGYVCPVIGNVTMDQILIDVSSVKNVREGTEVVILGQQRKAIISADDLARKVHTINYEIVCNLGNQLPRLYV